MTRGLRIWFGLVAAISVANTSHAASGQSPLRQPVETLKATLAKELGCTWKSLYGETCRTEKIPLYRAEIMHGENGSIDVRFSPSLWDVEEFVKIKSGYEADTAEKQQQDVINAIAKLFPAWKESRTWLRDAITQSKKEMFQTSLRVSDTSIYVRHHAQLTGALPDYTYIVVTMDRDLHAFKYYNCRDDEQGWAAEGCDADDGYTPNPNRPPDNPVLMPK